MAVLRLQGTSGCHGLNMSTFDYDSPLRVDSGSTRAYFDSEDNVDADIGAH